MKIAISAIVLLRINPVTAASISFRWLSAAIPSHRHIHTEGQRPTPRLQRDDYRLPTREETPATSPLYVQARSGPNCLCN